MSLPRLRSAPRQRGERPRSSPLRSPPRRRPKSAAPTSPFAAAPSPARSPKRRPQSAAPTATKDGKDAGKDKDGAAIVWSFERDGSVAGFRPRARPRSAAATARTVERLSARPLSPDSPSMPLDNKLLVGLYGSQSPLPASPGSRPASSPGGRARGGAQQEPLQPAQIPLQRWEAIQRNKRAIRQRSQQFLRTQAASALRNFETMLAAQRFDDAIAVLRRAHSLSLEANDAARARALSALIEHTRGSAIIQQFDAELERGEYDRCVDLLREAQACYRTYLHSHELRKKRLKMQQEARQRGERPRRGSLEPAEGGHPDPFERREELRYEQTLDFFRRTRSLGTAERIVHHLVVQQAKQRIEHGRAVAVRSGRLTDASAAYREAFASLRWAQVDEASLRELRSLLRARCAVVIQSCVRGTLGRLRATTRRRQLDDANTQSAVSIQSAFRGHMGRRNAQVKVMVRKMAQIAATSVFLTDANVRELLPVVEESLDEFPDTVEVVTAAARASVYLTRAANDSHKANVAGRVVPRLLRCYRELDVWDARASVAHAFASVVCFADCVATVGNHGVVRVLVDDLADNVRTLHPEVLEQLVHFVAEAAGALPMDMERVAPPVVRALQLHEGSADIQIRGGVAVARLGKCPGGAAALVDAGAVAALCAAHKRHADDDKVLAAATEGLTSLSGSVRSKEPMRLVTRSLRNQPRFEHHALAALVFVTGMSGLFGENAMPLLRMGAVPGVVAAMEQHPGDKRLQLAGIRAMTALAVDVHACTQMVDARGVEASAHALRRDAANAELVYTACQLFWRMSRCNDDLAGVLIERHAVATMFDVMKHHQRNTELVDSANLTYSNVIVRAPAAMKAVVLRSAIRHRQLLVPELVLPRMSRESNDDVLEFMARIGGEEYARGAQEYGMFLRLFLGKTTPAGKCRALVAAARAATMPVAEKLVQDIDVDQLAVDEALAAAATAGQLPMAQLLLSRTGVEGRHAAFMAVVEQDSFNVDILHLLLDAIDEQTRAAALAAAARQGHVDVWKLLLAKVNPGDEALDAGIWEAVRHQRMTLVQFGITFVSPSVKREVLDHTAYQLFCAAERLDVSDVEQLAPACPVAAKDATLLHLQRERFPEAVDVMRQLVRSCSRECRDELVARWCGAQGEAYPGTDHVLHFVMYCSQPGWEAALCRLAQFGHREAFEDLVGQSRTSAAAKDAALFFALHESNGDSAIVRRLLSCTSEAGREAAVAKLLQAGAPAYATENIRLVASLLSYEVRDALFAAAASNAHPIVVRLLLSGRGQSRVNAAFHEAVLANVDGSHDDTIAVLRSHVVYHEPRPKVGWGTLRAIFWRDGVEGLRAAVDAALRVK